MQGIGPRNPFCQYLHATKYRQRDETFDDYCVRYARTTADDEKHFRGLLDGLRSQAILPGGRQQRAVGWPFLTTAMNCFVGDTIPDDTEGIGGSLTESMLTLRSGGGDGWDFSPLRPSGEPVRKLGDDAYASGPVSFMGIWHAMCDTIRSAGERRGAMMGVLRVDHPDIMRFIRAKENDSKLTNFNISVAVTEEFMEAVYADKAFSLRWPPPYPPCGPRSETPTRPFRDVRALDLWSIIMENNWDWAEPGVLFIDTINRMNPLWYCEYIAATNPCGEEPLPPNGACLLLSHNLAKYLVPSYSRSLGTHEVLRNTNGRHYTDPRAHAEAIRSARAPGYEIDLDRLAHDVNLTVRACDNVFENTVYPLEAQRLEAFAKRRMGVGVTGVANALAVCGYRYATPEYLDAQDRILEVLRNAAYRTSIAMARVKGSFPLFDAEKWLASGFAQTLPEDIRHDIHKYGLRNGLLLSIAPTGTISLSADNVSSGIEPPPFIEGERVVNLESGQQVVSLNDWAFEEHGLRCRTALETTPTEHVEVLCRAQRYVDSAISKTNNLRGARQSPAHLGETTFAEFKDIYLLAHKGGTTGAPAKGCTTFNVNGKRAGILRERSTDGAGPGPSGGQPDALCQLDPATGARTCG